MAFRMYPDKDGIKCVDDETLEHVVVTDGETDDQGNVYTALESAQRWFNALNQKRKDEYEKKVAAPVAQEMPSGEALPVPSRVN